MPSLRPIHIALNFNDKYWALAYTVMRSICLSTMLRKEVVFHLVHTALTLEHESALEEITTEFGARLCHYDPTKNPDYVAAIARLPATNRFPAIVYGRLLLDRLLPVDVTRVVYLDCDTMVRRPIEELYDIDLNGKALAAVSEPYHDGIKFGRDIKTKKSPFDSAEPYFNSGVMLINRASLADADIPTRIEEMSKAGILDQIYFDQDLLNYIFRGQWHELDWRFNLINPRKAHETLGVRVLHYTGHIHPWFLLNALAFSRTYRHVMTNKVFYQYWRERMISRVRRLVGLK